MENLNEGLQSRVQWLRENIIGKTVVVTGGGEWAGRTGVADEIVVHGDPTDCYIECKVGSSYPFVPITDVNVVDD